MRAMLRLIAVASLLAIAMAGIAQQHPNQEKGFDPTKVYQFGDVDSINTFNGNLVVTLPVMPAFRVGPALSYGLTAVYNSNVWDGAMAGDYFKTVPCQRCNAGIGWVLSFGRLIPPSDPTNGTLNSGSFVYEGPDGRDHPLTTPGNPTNNNPTYPIDTVTADEMVLHFHADFGVAKLEFPDGTSRTFTKVGDGADTHWNLTRIDDRFGNSIVIAVTNGPEPNHPAWTHETWTVLEYSGTTLNRTSTVEWTTTVDHSDSDPMGTTLKQTTVQSITTQAFNNGANAPAKYTFHYDASWLSRNGADTTGGSHGGVPGAPYKALMLKSIELPSGESYAMTYETCANNCVDTAQVRSVTLPTGAKYEWTYTLQGFPGMPVPAGGQPDNHVLTPPESFRLISVAVAERHLTDIGGRPAGVWYYKHMASDPVLCSLPDGTLWKLRPEFVGTVTGPDRTTTATYYSTVIDIPESDCLIAAGWNIDEYGLPIIHWGDDAGGRHLSTEVYTSNDLVLPPAFTRGNSTSPSIGGAGTLRRTTRATYDFVTVGGPAVEQEISSRTIFNDDSDHYVETFRSGQDNFGHFRQVSTGGDFGNGPVYRTTFTNYPVRATNPQPTDWQFETYTEQCSRTETSLRTTPVTGCSALGAGATRDQFSWKQFCFNPTGFLARQRVIGDGRGARTSVTPGDGDLLAVFTPAATGDVDTEAYYGGETASGAQLPMEAGDVCTVATGAVGYSIHHTYQAGALKTSQYSGASFKSVDRDIDANTGLVSKERDAAGVETTYDYDNSGRLTSQTTPGLASLSYQYTAADLSAVPPKKAFITATQNGGADGSKTGKYFLDGFGRVTRELAQTDVDGHQRGHDTTFDEFGRKLTETTTGEYTSDDAPPPATASTFSYDFAGRPLQITPPDSTTNNPTYTTFVYKGSRESDRTAFVATPQGASTEATTKEFHDPLGRLTSVLEPEAATANDNASYSYDVDDRLIGVAMTGNGVTQHRAFTYDGRGFLLGETHPELGQSGNGSVDYKGYDARGHLLRKVTGGSSDFDLTYDYDAAERLTMVRKTGASTNDFLKKFIYGDTVPTLSASGKVAEALRYNSVKIGGPTGVAKPVLVDEQYNYDGTTGFLHDKKTIVRIDGSEVQNFTQTYGYDLFGDLKTLGYPAPSTASAPSRTITNLYHNGFLVGVDGYAGALVNGQIRRGITYLPNGMVGNVTHTSATGLEAQIDKQEADQTGMPRPAKITFTGYCVGPSVNPTEPADATVIAGHTATLSVTPPAGIAAPTYQWYRINDGIPQLIAGATASHYTTDVLNASAGYYVLVGDGSCTTQSRTANVTVRTCTTIDITTQPQSQSVPPGTATLNVTASAPGAHYQWYKGQKGDVSLAVGGDSDTLTVTVSQATSYWVRVFSADRLCSVDSSTAVISICANVFITQQPADSAREFGTGQNPLTAHIEFAGGTPFHVQWFVRPSTTPVLDHTVSTTFDDLTWNVPAKGTYTLYAKVIDHCGTEASSADFTMTAYDHSCTNFTILGLSADQIEVPRSSMSYPVTVTVDPADTGNGDYHYQWFNNRDVAVGTDSPTLYAGAQTYQSYYVKVSRTCSGTTTTHVSGKVYVSVALSCPIAPVSINPTRIAVAASAPVTFQAVTEWPLGIHYDWYRGQTGDTREHLPSVPNHPDQLTDSRPSLYWVRITNDCGLTQDSPVATLENNGTYFCKPVVITQQPQSMDIAGGQTPTLSVDAISTPDPFIFSWYKGLDNLTPQQGNGNSFVPPAPVTETTTYWVNVGNGCSSEKSAYATLHVVSCGDNQIVTQPADKVTDTTHPVTLTVAVSNPAAVTSYQWYRGASGDASQSPLGTSTTFTPPLDASATYWVRMTTAGCTFDSRAASVDVCVPPVIDHAQTDYSIQRGTGTWVSVTAHGTNLTYQWYGGTTGDTTNPILNFDKPAFYVVGSDTTSYWCRVSNRCNHADTPTITVSVCPAIDQQPVATNDTVMPGTTTTLTASAGGTLHWYQGEQGDTSHPFGGNSSTVTTPPITADTTFWLRAMSGTCGTDSNPVHVHLCTQPTVAWGSVATQIRPGDPVNLNVVVVPQSDDVTFYQGNLGDTTHPIGGGLSVTLYPTQTTTYWARARLGNCYADTNALTVSVCFPKITQQPAGSMLLNQQTPVTLSVTAQAATSYQWYSGSRDDGTSVLIPNATSSSISVAPNADTHYWVRVQGSCGFVDSDEVVITVCQPPANLNHLGDSYIQRGQTASFSVAAATGTNLTYQWYQGTAPDTTTPIANATSANLPVAPYDTTSYWVRVTSTCGTKDSNTGTVHVCVTPSITAQPQSVTIVAGSTTTLSVTATSGTSEPLHYNWYRIDPVSGQVPAGTDSNTFTTPALSDMTSYQVTVSSLNCSVDSSVATVSMCVYPASIAAPSGGQTHVGQTIAISGLPSDGTNQYLFYQGASGDTSHPLTSWQAANSISVSPTVTTQYWYQLKNGPCTSNSGTATVSVCIPTITSQPASVMINSGQTATLSVTANTSGLTYQWYIGTSGQSGSPISGATSSTYTTPPLTTATNYWVLVTGSCGQVAGSDTAAVTICQPPAITQTLQGAQWIARGNSGTVWIAATGTNLTYQWYTGTPGNTAAPVAGATAASVSVSPQNTTNYWCRVSGTCGSQDSIALTVNVCAAPVITTQPQGASVFSGGSTTLSVAATEATTSPVTYQWYQGTSGTTTTPISGATSTTFTTPTLTSDTSYWVRVSCGTCNPADSQTATVSICPYPATVSGPSDAYIAVGQTTRLATIPQNGSSSNTYRWYRGASLDTSNPVTGWQTINYYDASPTVTTQYWAQVQTGSCVTRTLATNVNVCIPTITTQPASLMINPGASTTLTVVANTSGLTYQWYIGTTGTTTSPISGATGSSLTITPSVTTNYWVKVTGTCSQSVNSNTATVTVCQVPTITGYTPSASIARGTTTTLTITASGTNPTYQWYVGSAGNTAAPISGATNASVAVQPNDNTNYWCRVSGTCGTRDSVTIPVSVCTTPSITAQPQSATIFAGSSTTLSVTAASGTSSPISYQWYAGTSGSINSPINGATSASYNTGALSSPASYWVRVSCGVCTPADSATATVSMCPYPPTLASPGDSQVTVGQTVRLFGASYASGNLYRWYAGASGNTSTPVGNWSSNNYVDVAPTVTTSYWYQLQNVCTSNSAAGTLYVCVPTFTQQPQNVTIVAGSPTTLTATANTAGVTYQWYVGASGNTASPISGATGSSVTVTPASTTSYWVRAWSTCNRGTDSNAATVTVCTIPVISRQPGNASPINPGWAGTTDVVANGVNLTYQWYRGESGDTSSPISGATGSSVTVSIFSSLRVWVRVTNLCGFVNSNAAWISVYPTISGPTQSTTTLSAGSMATVSVGATGTSLHYDWRLNGNSVGTDSPTLNVQINTGGSGVTCDVTSGIATSHSQTAYFDLCNGLYIYSITTYPQPNGCKTLAVNVDQPQWVQSVDWFQGPRGDTSHPVTSWPVCPTTATQYWARVHNWDDPTQTSCYTDSQTVTLP